ncbi:MAG: hypothetical protein IGBAC_0454 [Ignavibacteriae bacterium]|nr:MAG: hypothetical protein IGBAC_0454 [Ignavibacteriota bacterium]
MALDKKQKAFRYFPVMPIEANSLNFERAIIRLLVLLYTKGKVIAQTSKDTLYPENLVELVKYNKTSFEGVDDPLRERLMKNWIVADYATTVVEGKGRKGRTRVAHIKPLHLSTIKLYDPRIKSHDREISTFLYNVFKGSSIASDSDFLMSYLLEGTKRFGEYDLKVDEEKFDGLDIETQFLLRLLENFKVDKPSTGVKLVQNYNFICEAQRKQILTDTLKVLVYKNSVPRRELFNYLTIIFRFHTAVFSMKTYKQIISLVNNKKLHCGLCKSIQNEKDFDKLGRCDFQPKIFVDLTLGQDKICDTLAKKSTENNYNEMYRYFKAHYKLAKLAEFAKIRGINEPNIEDLLEFEKHSDGYFEVKLGEIITDEDLRGDPDIQEILNLNISPLDKYIEVLCNDKSNWKNLVNRHKKFMSAICSMNNDDGFLQGGRGKRRKYVLGNLLLEVLVQLAVVSADARGFKTQPITIVSFVEWLKNRYGIYINEWPEDNDSPEIAKALNNNYEALKNRLRQLGFYTDLSDASNSQVIKPRFKIEPEIQKV